MRHVLSSHFLDEDATNQTSRPRLVWAARICLPLAVMLYDRDGPAGSGAATPSALFAGFLSCLQGTTKLFEIPPMDLLSAKVYRIWAINTSNCGGNLLAKNKQFMQLIHRQLLFHPETVPMLCAIIRPPLLFDSMGYNFPIPRSCLCPHLG